MATPTAPTRRERERERHRREILDAARKVLDARGLSGLTIEEVAREAEFAVGSIYRHFRSKEELIELLVVHVFEPLCEEVEAIATSGEPFEAQLGAAIERMFAHLREDLPLLQVFYAAGGGVPLPSAASTDRMQAARERIFAAFEAVIVRGQVDRVLPDGDPRPMTVALLALLSGTKRITGWGIGGPELDLAELVRRTFLDGCRRR